MNPILYHYIKKQMKQAGTPVSNFVLAKSFRIVKINIKRNIKDILLITLGVFSAGFGLKGFLLPNQFVDGGAMGIALILAKLTSINLGYLIVLANLPFVILGYRVISKRFSIKTVIAIILLALVTALFPYPVITNDKLLIAVFGGFFLGAGIGLSVRGGCVIDGTEVLAVQVSKKTSLTIGDFILIFNILLFLVVAYLFDVQVAMYSILTYLAASKTIDFIIEGIDEYMGVTIVSSKHESIRKMITTKLRSGVTVYHGARGYINNSGANAHTEILYTVVTRLEISTLKNEIEKIDPYAFVVMSAVKDTKGGVIKKRSLPH